MKRSTTEEVKKAILQNVEAVLEQLDDEYTTASEKASEVFGSAKEKASQAYENVKEKVADSREKTVDYIKDNPEKSILVAAGVGALVALAVSFFVGRRRD